jgi:DNA-binding NarL/FixJ family response regulator
VNPPVRVLIADGQALVSAGFRVLLEAEDGISVVGTARTSDGALALTRSTRPDVLLMDLALPGRDGVQTTRRILAEPGLAHVKVLMLSPAASDGDVLAALRAGARGVLLKSIDAGELVHAVRVVAEGQRLLSPEITRTLLAELDRLPQSGLPSAELLDRLTRREREVVALVAHGCTNEEIAARLVVSPATAKTHVSRAMVKLHARDRAHLVVLAYEGGLVLPADSPETTPA